MKGWTAVLAALLCSATQVAGAFGFDPYQVYDVGAPVQSVSVGDVDGDGRDDVVLMTAYTGEGYDRLFVFFQRVDGTLDLPVIFEYGALYPVNTSLALADLNHDGIEDIIVGNDAGITVFMGNNARELNGTQTNGKPAPLLGTMDVDRDGHLDVIAPYCCWGVIYYGDGSGGIREQSELRTAAEPYGGFKVGDLNSDGFDDLAITSGSLYIYLHDRISGFKLTPEVIWPNFDGYFIGGTAIGDFNDDDRNDVVIGMRAGSPTRVSIYQQEMTRVTRAGPVNLATDAYPRAMLSNDIDGDGRDDLLVLHQWSTYKVGLYLQGDAGLQSETLAETPGGQVVSNMAIGDINGDGCKDVVIAGDSFTEGLAVLHGNDCQVRPDLLVAVGLTPTTAAIRLEHIWGPTPIQQPLVQLDLAVRSGVLQTGTLPDGCVVQTQSERARRIECLAATLAPGTNSTLIIPVNVIGGDQFNTLQATVEASTDTPERSLANNQAAKTISLFPGTHRIPVPVRNGARNSGRVKATR